MKKTNIITVMVILVILVSILSGCKKDTSVIKIGFSYELTGPNSELGRDAMYGALLAINQINSAGGIDGRELELIIKNDEGNPDIGVLVDNELIAEGCVAIIGHGTSNMAKKTIDNANINDFILLSPTISTYEYEDVDDNFFRMIPSNSTQGIGLGEFIMHHSPNDVMIFTENNNAAFTETVSNSLIDYLSTTNYVFNPEYLIEFNTKNEASYQMVANTINTNSIENIVIIGSSFDVSSILQSDLKDGINVYIPVWATTLDLFNLSGALIKNTHGINYFNLESQDPKYIEFLHHYSVSYGLVPSFSSMLSYESVYTLAEALKEAESFSTADIKASLLQLGSVNWLIDDLNFNLFGDVIRKLYWYNLKDGTFSEVE